MTQNCDVTRTLCYRAHFITVISSAPGPPRRCAGRCCPSPASCPSRRRRQPRHRGRPCGSSRSTSWRERGKCQSVNALKSNDVSATTCTKSETTAQKQRRHSAAAAAAPPPPPVPPAGPATTTPASSSATAATTTTFKGRFPHLVNRMYTPCLASGENVK